MIKDKIITSIQSLKNTAESLAYRVKNFPEGGIVILLSGEVGTGKTTFSRYFAEAFGEKNLSSPTFSLVEKYDLSYKGYQCFFDTINTSGIKSPKKDWDRFYPEKKVNYQLVHADFYRADLQRMEDILEEELFSTDEQPDKKKIFVLEWLPKQLEKEFFAHVPVIKIDFEHTDTPENRLMKIRYRNPYSLSVDEARKMLVEFVTPVHVQDHIEKVRQVAVFTAKKLVSAGVPVDVELVESSAILHDVVRYVDFPRFDTEDLQRYKEEVTPKKLNFWLDLREKYKRVHHADAVADILCQQKKYATARVCATHKTGDIYRNTPFSYEEKCVFYADKRALHDSIVSLDERLKDGRIRYAHKKNVGLEKLMFDLEKELCDIGKFLPEDVAY